MIQLQYRHKDNPDRPFMVTITSTWFEPGDPESDPFMLEGVEFGCMRAVSMPEVLQGLDSEMRLISIRTEGDKITYKLNHGAIDAICAQDPNRKRALISTLEGIFEDIKGSIATFPAQGGTA